MTKQWREEVSGKSDPHFDEQQKRKKLEKVRRAFGKRGKRNLEWQCKQEKNFMWKVKDRGRWDETNVRSRADTTRARLIDTGGGRTKSAWRGTRSSKYWNYQDKTNRAKRQNEKILTTHHKRKVVSRKRRRFKEKTNTVSSGEDKSKTRTQAIRKWKLRERGDLELRLTLLKVLK